MKFTVLFVDEGKLTCLGEDKKSLRNSQGSQKSLRYELPKNTDLSLHVLNIHKSLVSLGFPIIDGPQKFTLRIRPISETELKEFPAYLKESGPEIDAQVVQLSNILPKSQRKKGLILELILTPETRSQRFITLLQDKSLGPLKIKETAFNLATQTKVS